MQYKNINNFFFPYKEEMLVPFIYGGKPSLVSIVQLCPLFLNGGRKEGVNLFLYNPINVRTFLTFY